MKNINVCNLALIAVAVLAAVSTAHAQDITFGAAQTISGDSNLIDAADTPGITNIDALAMGGGAVAGPVDGVTFNVGLTDGVITLAGLPSQTKGAFFSGYTGAGSTNFVSLIDSGVAYNSPAADGTLTISAAALTAGDTYELQIFSDSTDGTNNTTTFSSANSVGLQDNDGTTDGVGQFVTGTFVATGSNEVVSISPGATYSVIGSVNLVEEAVPEPSTYALMLGGLALLFIQLRRRRHLSS
jgi:PEP-CTERM motif